MAKDQRSKRHDDFRILRERCGFTAGFGAVAMKREIDPAVAAEINHRCQKYAQREREQKEWLERLNKSINMGKVEKWRKIEEHQHREYDQDDIDLGFV